MSDTAWLIVEHIKDPVMRGAWQRTLTAVRDLDEVEDRQPKGA